MSNTYEFGHCPMGFEMYLATTHSRARTGLLGFAGLPLGETASTESQRRCSRPLDVC